MNPIFLVKPFSCFSREVFELQIRPMPIFESSFQGLSDGQKKYSLWPTQELKFDKHDFEPYILLVIGHDNRDHETSSNRGRLERFTTYFSKPDLNRLLNKAL